MQKQTLYKRNIDLRGRGATRLATEYYRISSEGVLKFAANRLR